LKPLPTGQPTIVKTIAPSALPEARALLKQDLVKAFA